ncbi:serine-rich adhesin for platelets-like [Palaemon carinicauda]|uniref:serine-rich adhesin for platelets-like n=1 Tax=Palaemon carinicauda TaxID=392227 RepID=UPI0035B65F41
MEILSQDDNPSTENSFRKAGGPKENFDEIKANVKSEGNTLLGPAIENGDVRGKLEMPEKMTEKSCGPSDVQEQQSDISSLRDIIAAKKNKIALLQSTLQSSKVILKHSDEEEGDTDASETKDDIIEGDGPCERHPSEDKGNRRPSPEGAECQNRNSNFETAVSDISEGGVRGIIVCSTFSEEQEKDDTEVKDIIKENISAESIKLNENSVTEKQHTDKEFEVINTNVIVDFVADEKKVEVHKSCQEITEYKVGGGVINKNFENKTSTDDCAQVKVDEITCEDDRREKKRKRHEVEEQEIKEEMLKRLKLKYGEDYNADEEELRRMAREERRERKRKRRHEKEIKKQNQETEPEKIDDMEEGNGREKIENYNVKQKIIDPTSETSQNVTDKKTVTEKKDKCIVSNADKGRKEPENLEFLVESIKEETHKDKREESVKDEEKCLRQEETSKVATEESETTASVRRRKREPKEETTGGLSETFAGFSGFNFIKKFEEIVEERRRRRSRRLEEAESNEALKEHINQSVRRRSRQSLIDETNTSVENDQSVKRRSLQSLGEESILPQQSEQLPSVNDEVTLRRRQQTDDDSSQTRNSSANSKDYEEIFARRQRKRRTLEGDSSQTEERSSLYISQESICYDGGELSDKVYDEIFERRRRLRRQRYANLYKMEGYQEEKGGDSVGSDKENTQNQEDQTDAPDKMPTRLSPSNLKAKSPVESESEDSDSDSNDSSKTKTKTIRRRRKKTNSFSLEENIPKEGGNELSTSSYGAGRYGNSVSSSRDTGAVPTVSYRAALSREASLDRSGTGYGSGSDSNRGYGSGSGYSSSSTYKSPISSTYTSRFRDRYSPPSTRSTGGSTYISRFSSNDKSPNSSLGSKFNDVKPSTTSSPRVRPTSLSMNSSSTTTNVPNNSHVSSSSVTSRFSQDSPHSEGGRSPSSYTSRLGSGTNFERSGYNSDAKSGYGSDYKSGYGSGSGSYTNRYNSYSRSNSYLKDSEPAGTYKPSYSRENSYLGSDTGTGSSWRSRIYGSDIDKNATATPYTRTRTQDLTSTSGQTVGTSTIANKAKDVSLPQFKDAIDKLTKAAMDDKSQPRTPEAPSPNAVRVLPIFDPGEVKLKNKAPADFSSGGESSDEEDKAKKVNGSGAAQKTSTAPSTTAMATSTYVARPLRHLAAVPSLPTKSFSSATSGLVEPPSFKLSSKYSTLASESIPSAPTPRWMRDKDNTSSTTTNNLTKSNLSVGESSPKSLSPLPPRSPVPGSGKTGSSVSPNRNNTSSPTVELSFVPGVGNKECRKSVLNMDLDPRDTELMRKQQEEKREELRRLRRQRGNEDDKSRRPPPSTLRTKPGNKTEDSVQSKSEQSKVNEEDEGVISGGEGKRDDKPPVAPSLEKTSSKGRVVERKHSKGKGDTMRHSGSMRRFRQSSQASKSSSSETSSDSEEDVPVVTVTLSRRRRQNSRDDAFGSSGDNHSRPSSRSSPRGIKKGSSDEIKDGKKSRNNSSSNLGRRSRNNSSSNLSKSRSGNNSRGSIGEGEKSRSNSRTGILGDKKLSLGPDIDIGESRAQVVKTSSSHSSSKLRRSATKIQRTKDRKASEKTSSSSSETSETSDSSESAGEEGQFFSLSKSRSLKKSKSGLSNYATNRVNDKSNLEELGDRTSPDGKEHVSRTNSDVNVQTRGSGSASRSSSKGTISKQTIDKSNSLEPFEWPSGSPEMHISKKAAQEENFNFEWPSGSPELHTYKKAQEQTEEDNFAFEWPSGSPELHLHKKAQAEAQAANFDFEWPSGSPELHLHKKAQAESDAGEFNFEWPSRSPELHTYNKAMAEEQAENDNFNFEWPSGSPEMHLHKKAQAELGGQRNSYGDSETETDLGWSDGSGEVSKMEKVDEETEEDYTYFEWPSSPDFSKKRPYSYYSEGYDTQGETENFEWPSSPELPRMKNPKFISFTEDIDKLLNDNQGEESFAAMETLMGYSPPPAEEDVVEEEDADDNKSTASKISKTSKSSGKSSIAGEEEEEEEEEETEQSEEKKESLKDRARRNLSLFIGKLTNIDEILGSVLQPLTTVHSAPKSKASVARSEDGGKSKKKVVKKKHVKKDSSGMEEVDASEVKVHDAKANRAQIDENIEEIDVSAVIIREKEKREALRAEIISAVKAGLDDVTLQVYRDGDYGTYLDLESSLAEQAEDIDALTDRLPNG